MSNHSAAEVALDALGEPQRRQIIRQLQGGPLPVGKLADLLTIGRPAVSKHLRVLQGAGLVDRRTVGTRNLYSLAPQALVPLQQWLNGVWATTLASFADHIAQRPPDTTWPSDDPPASESSARHPAAPETPPHEPPSHQEQS